MAPKVKTKKDEIISGAIELIRECGIDALCARSLAKRLGMSTQPIFSNFSSMEELFSAVIDRAREISFEYTKRVVMSGKYPPYKCSGMAYIGFARDEGELFRLLFMRSEGRVEGYRGYEDIIGEMGVGLGIDFDTAKELHFQMWSFVHGIATMINTGYLSLSEEQIGEMLTNVYEGLKFRYGLEAKQKSK